LQKAKGDCLGLSPLRPDGFGTLRWEAGPGERQPKALRSKLAQGGCQARVHSDQMVHIMVQAGG
jgi:hypothetical protein